MRYLCFCTVCVFCFFKNVVILLSDPLPGGPNKPTCGHSLVWQSGWLWRVKNFLYVFPQEWVCDCIFQQQSVWLQIIYNPCLSYSLFVSNRMMDRRVKESTEQMVIIHMHAQSTLTCWQLTGSDTQLYLHKWMAGLMTGCFSTSKMDWWEGKWPWPLSVHSFHSHNQKLCFIQSELNQY